MSGLGFALPDCESCRNRKEPPDRGLGPYWPADYCRLGYETCCRCEDPECGSFVPSGDFYEIVYEGNEEYDDLIMLRVAFAGEEDMIERYLDDLSREDRDVRAAMAELRKEPDYNPARWKLREVKVA